MMCLPPVPSFESTNKGTRQISARRAISKINGNGPYCDRRRYGCDIQTSLSPLHSGRGDTRGRRAAGVERPRGYQQRQGRGESASDAHKEMNMSIDTCVPKMADTVPERSSGAAREHGFGRQQKRESVLKDMSNIVRNNYDGPGRQAMKPQQGNRRDYCDTSNSPQKSAAARDQIAWGGSVGQGETEFRRSYEDVQTGPPLHSEKLGALGLRADADRPPGGYQQRQDRNGSAGKPHKAMAIPIGGCENDADISAYCNRNGELTIIDGGEKEFDLWQPDDGDEGDVMQDYGVRGKYSSSGWNAEEMFRHNEQIFGMETDYDPSNTQYTTVVSHEEGTAEEYRLRAERARRIADEINKNPASRAVADLENDDDEPDMEGETAKPQPAPTSGGNQQNPPPSPSVKSGNHIPVISIKKKVMIPEQWQHVQKIWNGRSSDTVVSDNFKIQITVNHLKTLSELNWLNDEVINFYLEMISERSKAQSELPSVYIFTTFFYENLSKFGFASVKRWTRNEGPQGIFKYNILIVPVHLKKEKHWILVVLDLRSSTMTLYDSLGGRHDSVLQTLLSYLGDESQDKLHQPFDDSEFRLLHAADQGIPRQMNGSDCGVFACQFAEHISRDAKIAFSQRDMPQFRKVMACQILEQRLALTF